MYTVHVRPTSYSQNNFNACFKARKTPPYLDFVFGYTSLIQTSAGTQTHYIHPLICFIWKLCDFATDVSLTLFSMFTFQDCICASSAESLVDVLVQRHTIKTMSFHNGDISGCCYTQQRLVARWFHSRVRLDRGEAMSTFTGNKLTCRWVIYVDWKTTLFKVKLVRILKTAFNDFSISELRLEACISHHQRLPVSFHDVLMNNFVAWMALLFFEVSLVRLLAKSHSFPCVTVATCVRLQCDSLMVFLFDEKGLTKSTWPPCALGFFMSQAVLIMFFFATSTLQYGLHCGASKQGLRLVFHPQVCANDSFMTTICGGEFASESSNLFCVIFVVHWLP